MGVGVGVVTPLALIALVITLTAVFKLKRSKTTLQRKLTERGYVIEVVIEVYCPFTIFNTGWLNMS